MDVIANAIQSVERRAVKVAWDAWYSELPADLKAKLSIHDFRRLGDVFHTAFCKPAGKEMWRFLEDFDAGSAESLEKFARKMRTHLALSHAR